MCGSRSGMATDSRGRLWVAENNTYSDANVNFDLSQRDRIVILEDTDHDGRADKHTVFWDQGPEADQRRSRLRRRLGPLSSAALVHPRPQRRRHSRRRAPGRARRLGRRRRAAQHRQRPALGAGRLALRPARHSGHFATSDRPGALPSQRTPLNCCIWRYHPTRKIFEVVCRGTTNPWGMDWNEPGELFFINTVIGHLWHAVPGAITSGCTVKTTIRTLRTPGSDGRPLPLGHRRALERHPQNRRLAHDRPGRRRPRARGSDDLSGRQLARRYRGTLFTINLHGRRLNNDILERQGAGYVGPAWADFLKSSDPWFRGLELIAGPDGGRLSRRLVRHRRMPRQRRRPSHSGRIFKVIYGDPHGQRSPTCRGWRIPSWSRCSFKRTTGLHVSPAVSCRNGPCRSCDRMSLRVGGDFRDRPRSDPQAASLVVSLRHWGRFRRMAADTTAP